jgi:predicted dehydrogenase
MPIKLAIVGFRHPHINDLVSRVQEHDDIELVAACEEDPATRLQLLQSGAFRDVYPSYADMFDEVEFDAVGIGDYYSVRGSRAIKALRRGKHVISDKPLCTRLRELEEIELLVRSQQLVVGCMLDMRSNGAMRRLRRMVAEGTLGQIVAVSFGGQHPLMYGTRAGWYFEEGKHGGTINDIAVHAFDFIPWLTGVPFKEINAARNWNARLPQVRHFRDAAQVMLTLQNGAGVLGDVSYCAPDSHGYAFPLYWRVTVWGSEGVAEFAYNSPCIELYKNGETEKRLVEADPAAPGEYLDAFVQAVNGVRDTALTTNEVLAASRVAVLAQQMADAAYPHSLTGAEPAAG